MGRTDFWISVYRAKFDEEADFEVHSAVARQNPAQIDEKQNFRSKIFAEKDFRRRKPKRPELSEMRFGKVSHRSEPCSEQIQTPVPANPGPVVDRRKQFFGTDIISPQLGSDF